MVSDSRATHLCHLATLTCKSSFCCKKTEMEDLKSCLARDDHGWQSWLSFYLLSRIPNSCSCPCSVLHKKRHMAISQEPWYIIDPLLSKRPRKKKKSHFLKNALFSKKVPIFKKCSIFTGPDLKRAWRTGLSARRAQRTKSRGPKGLQLKVGAWRPPRHYSATDATVIKSKL